MLYSISFTLVDLIPKSAAIEITMLQTIMVHPSKKRNEMVFSNTYIDNIRFQTVNEGTLYLELKSVCINNI